jgi:hypothetical protein
MEKDVSTPGTLVFKPVAAIVIMIFVLMELFQGPTVAFC